MVLFGRSTEHFAFDSIHTKATGYEAGGSNVSMPPVPKERGQLRYDPFLGWVGPCLRPFSVQLGPTLFTAPSLTTCEWP